MRQGLLGVVLLGILAAACGPSEQSIQATVDAKVAAAVATVQALPTATPPPTATPIPLPPPPTPQPTATPQPAPTPPPTPTPVAIPPTATPQPTPTPQRVVDFSAVYRRVWPSVFMIETATGRGTGWLMEPGLILTNQHVVGSSATVTVRQTSDPAFSARVVASDSRRDLALLSFAASAPLNRNASPLPLGQISAGDIGAALMALGYSGAGVKADGTVGSAAANVGILSQTITFTGSVEGRNLIMDVPIDPGDSGGPVFDSYGLVVGVNRAGQTSTGGGQRVVGTFFAVHVDEIRAALPALKSGQSR